MTRPSNSRLALLILLVVSTEACTSLRGRRLGPIKPNEMTAQNGVPYALSRPRFKLVRKTTAAGKLAAPTFDITTDYTADPSKRFEVGMSRGWFTSDTFELNLDPQGLASTLNAKRTDETGKTIAAMVKVAASAAALATKSGVMRTSKDRFAEICEALKKTPELDCTTEQQALGGLLRTADAKCATPGTTECIDAIKAFSDPAKTLRAGIVESIKAGLMSRCGLDLETDQSSTDNDPQYLQEFANYVTFIDATLASLDKTSTPPSKLDILATQITKLRTEVNDAMATYALSPKDPAAKARLELAISTLKDTINVIVDADNLLNNRALKERRATLLAFLRRTIPDGAKSADDHAAAYTSYAKLLSEVDTALDLMIPTKRSSADPLPDATEATSVIDRKIVVDRSTTPLDDAELAARVALAKLRIKDGCASAVVIVAPSTAAELPSPTVP